MSNQTADQKREMSKIKVGTYFGERAIDRANRNAKKPEGIGYHSGKENFKLNPNRKPTKATIKYFLKKGIVEKNLYIKQLSHFDGNTDCVMPIDGLWLVGESRDYFDAFQDENYFGYKIFNCCGSSIIAKKIKLESEVQK